MIGFLITLPALLLIVLVIFYLERKLASFIQDRLGPMEVGKFGMLQGIADLLKLLHKEDIVPVKADRLLFKAAPYVVFAAIFAGFCVVPLSSGFIENNSSLGVFFLMAIVALDVLGLLMAGWSSNNKYALFGAMRGVAQIISYELPVGLSILSVTLITGTLNLQEISFLQGIHTPEAATYLFGIDSLGIDIKPLGGFLSWNIFQAPHLLIAFIIFYIASLAECNRAPFDIPEAESELVAGFHVEYSGFRFAIFFLAEYGMMLLVSLLASILFLGAWNTPFPNLGSFKLAEYTTGTPGTLYAHLWGAFWLISKAFILMIVQVWVRWTFPRLRVDQLMYLCWKVLLPFALACVFLSVLVKVL